MQTDLLLNERLRDDRLFNLYNRMHMSETKHEFKIFDTKTRSIKRFPIDKPLKIYSCGPTVYWQMQIGNLRAYTEWDVMYRTLEYLGYDVQRYMNFTDVGHMTEDMDFGEDKIEVTAKKQGKDPETIADYYIDSIIEDFRRMNLLHPDGSEVADEDDHKNASKYNWLRATAYVEKMIEYVKQIEANGYTYETEQAVYFDTSKIEDYTLLSGQILDEQEVAVRDDVEEAVDKKHPADFVLWMKRKGKYEKHLQHWDSPWGDGFPGWHIECSAMSLTEIGEHIDIHTGGVDHISVHHTNERAQNIGSVGHEVVDAWVHNEHITAADGAKLSKSKGNANTLDELIEKGFDPLDLRYYFLGVKYRQPMHFSDENLEVARNTRLKVYRKVLNLMLELVREQHDVSTDEDIVMEPIVEEVDAFKTALADDLNVSAAMAVFHKVLGLAGEYKASEVLGTLIDLDRVLALDIVELIEQFEFEDLDAVVQMEAAVNKRDVTLVEGFNEYEVNLVEAMIAMLEFREEKNYEKADKLREEITQQIQDIISPEMKFDIVPDGVRFSFDLDVSDSQHEH